MTLPQTKPFETLADIALWQPGNDEFNVSSVPRRSSRASDMSGPKLLVCHDHQSVYRDDRFVQGLISSDEVYTFQHWNLIDFFIYFSHFRGTIPPPSWTNAAHRNGVPMLANFITEWEPGVAENLLLIYGPDFDKNVPGCGDDERKDGVYSTFFADKLVDMACYYKFDGWFFNIEAIVPSPVDARNLVLFLDYMTKEMHRRMPGSYVIWYDSLTINGELRWQNYLNHNNLPFFLVTDGIYTNYGWNAAQPFMSAELANKARDKINVNDLIDDIALNVSNVEADASTLKVSREIAVLTTVQRFLDAIPEEISNNLASYLVFTGTDVYGRGTYGGGGFNCHKALRISNDAKTSGAIFGLGWTYDNVVVKPDNTFTDTERRFWYDKDHRKGEGSFAIGCEKAGEPGAVDSADSGCIANEVKVRPVAMNISNSFYTNFDRGIGRSYSIEGMIVDTNSWTHIGRQHPLPTYPKGQHSVKAIHSNISSQTGSVNIRGLKSEVKGGDCWRGGSAFVVSALRILNQTNELNGIHTIDLYESEIALSEGYIIDVKCNRQEGVQIGLVIKLKLRKMGGVETLDERVVFPESKFVSRQWESMELDLSKLLDAERQNLATVVSFGIAVAGCSVVKKGSYQNLQDFKGVTDLGEDFSETGDAREMFELCRVGEIRIYKKADIIPHHLDGKMNFIDIDEVLVGKNEDAGETIIGRYLTLTWTVGEQHQLDEISWEVYVNEKWVGTAFVNRYRIGPIFESGTLKFLVKGFDDIGQIRLTSSGEYIFE